MAAEAGGSGGSGQTPDGGSLDTPVHVDDDVPSESLVIVCPMWHDGPEHEFRWTWPSWLMTSVTMQLPDDVAVRVLLVVLDRPGARRVLGRVLHDRCSGWPGARTAASPSHCGPYCVWVRFVTPLACSFWFSRCVPVAIERPVLSCSKWPSWPPSGEPCSWVAVVAFVTEASRSCVCVSEALFMPEPDSWRIDAAVFGPSVPSVFWLWITVARFEAFAVSVCFCVTLAAFAPVVGLLEHGHHLAAVLGLRSRRGDRRELGDRLRHARVVLPAPVLLLDAGVLPGFLTCARSQCRPAA